MLESWEVFYEGGYLSDKSSLFTRPVYFPVLSSSSLQCAWLLIHDVILIKPISRQGREQRGCWKSFTPVFFKTEASGEVKRASSQWGVMIIGRKKIKEQCSSAFRSGLKKKAALSAAHLGPAITKEKGKHSPIHRLGLLKYTKKICTVVV